MASLISPKMVYGGCSEWMAALEVIVNALQ